MSYFDLTYFQYGVGLVVMGWFIGVVIGIAFDLVRRVGSI